MDGIIYTNNIYIYIFINFAYNHMRSYINILLILIICHHNRQKTVHFVGHRATVTSHTHDSGYVFRHQALAAGASGACAAGYGPLVTLDGVIAGISPGLISHKCGVYHFHRHSGIFTHKCGVDDFPDTQWNFPPKNPMFMMFIYMCLDNVTSCDLFHPETGDLQRIHRHLDRGTGLAPRQNW